MSLQASWNTALGIVGGLSKLNKLEQGQKKQTEEIKGLKPGQEASVTNAVQAIEDASGIEFTPEEKDQLYRKVKKEYGDSVEKMKKLAKKVGAEGEQSLEEGIPAHDFTHKVQEMVRGQEAANPEFIGPLPEKQSKIREAYEDKAYQEARQVTRAGQAGINIPMSVSAARFRQAPQYGSFGNVDLNDIAAQRAQQHIQQSDTARNSGSDIVRNIRNRPDIQFHFPGGEY